MGITLFTVGVAESLRIARKVRAAAPSVTIIVGGPHVASMGLTIAKFPEFDLAVQGRRGEGPR